MYNENKTKNNRTQILVCTAIQQWDKTITTTTKTKFLLLTLWLGFSTYQFSVMHHFSQNSGFPPFVILIMPFKNGVTGGEGWGNPKLVTKIDNSGRWCKTNCLYLSSANGAILNLNKRKNKRAGQTLRQCFAVQ